jgi:thiaminase/transcriptional activator TenA
VTAATAAPATPHALSDELWAAGADVYQQILDHPFLTELTTGDLAPDRFRYYIVQDGHYLRQYAKALTTLAGRAPDNAATSLFAGQAASAIPAELSKQEELIAQLGAAGGGDDAPSPTTIGYTSFVLSAVHAGTFAEGVAAVLPCYWLYWAAADALAKNSSPNPQYAAWIDTYTSADFTTSVRSVLELTDRLAEAVTTAERDRMRDYYRTAARFEWMFWDAAYRMERWPV